MATYPTYISKGTKSEVRSGSYVTPTYMGSIMSGDYLFCLVVNQGNTTINAPYGFIEFTGSGVSPITILTGVKVAIFYRVAKGTETGTLSVSATGGTMAYMMAQLYLVRATSATLLLVEDINGTTGQTTTATWDTVTVASSLRSLYAFIVNWDDFYNAGTPTGYTSVATDSSSAISGVHFQLFEKQNVASDGSVTASASVNGWATWHISMYDLFFVSVQGGGSFIVN